MLQQRRDACFILEQVHIVRRQDRTVDAAVEQSNQQCGIILVFLQTDIQAQGIELVLSQITGVRALCIAYCLPFQSVDILDAESVLTVVDDEARGYGFLYGGIGNAGNGLVDLDHGKRTEGTDRQAQYAQDQAQEIALSFMGPDSGKNNDVNNQLDDQNQYIEENERCLAQRRELGNIEHGKQNQKVPEYRDYSQNDIQLGIVAVCSMCFACHIRISSYSVPEEPPWVLSHSSTLTRS